MRSTTPLEPARTKGAAIAALAVITACAAALRFYHLEDPSLWGDEVLLPLTARYPVAYILDWIAKLEVHPPYLYLLVKGIIACGKSDFALRTLFAVCGAAAIPLIHRVGSRLFKPGTGLLAAAFLAFDPLHIYISRVVRPYSLMVLVFLAAFLFFQRYLEKPSARNLGLLALLNAVLLCLHYSAIFVISSMGAVVMWRWLRRQGLTIRDAASFIAASALSFVPVAYFLVKAIQFKGAGAGMFPPLAFLGKYLSCAAGQFNAYAPQWSLYLALPLFLLGLADMFRRYRGQFVIFAFFLLVPFLMLFILRHGYYLTPWHLSVFLPVYILPCALGARFLLQGERPAELVATASALVLAVAILSSKALPFYEKDSLSGQFKELARSVAEIAPSGSVTVIDQWLFHGTNWYIGQFSAVNPLVEQAVSPNDGALRLNMVSYPCGKLGHYSENDESFVKRFGVPRETRTILNTRVYVYELARSPVLDAKGLPQRYDLSVEPFDFYRRVNAAKGVMINPFWRGGLIPVANDADAAITYVVANPARTYPQRIRWNVRYSMEGEGNRFSGRYRFDDEPPQTAFDLSGPQPGNFKEGRHETIPVDIRRDKPYRRLELTVLMRCAPITPKYDGGNLDTVRYGGADIGIDRIDTDLFDPSTLEQSIALESIGGVESGPEGRWRWALGGTSRIVFDLPDDRPVTLTYALTNPIPGQRLTIVANGVQVKDAPLASGKWMVDAQEDAVSFAGKKGTNAIEFRFADWNHGRTTFAPGDPSPYAAAFTRLRLDY